MKKIFLALMIILVSDLVNAQKINEIYFNYDELVGIQIESDSTLKVYYNVKGKPENQLTGFTKTDKGIRLGKLNYNTNPSIQKLSAEPMEFMNGNLYLPEYRMFFYSAEYRKIMENRDCYIVNNLTYFTTKGKIKGQLKKAIKNLRKGTLQTTELDSKTTYDKYGVHCLGATEILGIPIK